MPLTNEQAFKVGFLLRCAEEGLTNNEISNRIKFAHEKEALWPAVAALLGAGKIGTGAVTSLIGTIAKTAPHLLNLGLAAGVGAPLVAGGTTGYIAAKALSKKDNAVEEAKQDEVIGEYDRLADEARRRSRLKQIQQLTGRKVVALTSND